MLAARAPQAKISEIVFITGEVKIFTVCVFIAYHSVKLQVKHFSVLIWVQTVCKGYQQMIFTLVNVYVDLVVFTRIAGTS